MHACCCSPFLLLTRSSLLCIRTARCSARCFLSLLQSQSHWPWTGRSNWRQLPFVDCKYWISVSSMCKCFACVCACAWTMSQPLFLGLRFSDQCPMASASEPNDLEASVSELNAFLTSSSELSALSQAFPNQPSLWPAPCVQRLSDELSSLWPAPFISAASEPCLASIIEPASSIARWNA